MTGANVNVDLSHHNVGANLAAALGDGIKAVIHKATQSSHHLKELLGTATDPVLVKCWFWLSQYGPTPVVPPAWPPWTMWQYTDGALGPMPHEVAGIGRCDRDTFNGSADDLASFWKTNSASAPPAAT
jgi:GH25 family lysozyme M1 (1,4-beta-N-acetylmuramidase)